MCLTGPTSAAERDPYSRLLPYPLASWLLLTRDATALRAPESPRRNQGVPCYNDAMRAITLLLTGALVMANPAEVRRMVEARFNMRAMAQQPPEYNPDDIGPSAYLATPPPPPRLRRPLGMISTKEQSRLNDQLMYGCITPEQYVRATRMDNPPPGVEGPWGWFLKPVTQDSTWQHEERVRQIRKKGKKNLCRMMRSGAKP